CWLVLGDALCIREAGRLCQAKAKVRHALACRVLANAHCRQTKVSDKSQFVVALVGFTLHPICSAQRETTFRQTSRAASPPHSAERLCLSVDRPLFFSRLRLSRRRSL